MINDEVVIGGGASAAAAAVIDDDDLGLVGSIRILECAHQGYVPRIEILGNQENQRFEDTRQESVIRRQIGCLRSTRLSRLMRCNNILNKCSHYCLLRWIFQNISPLLY